MKKFFVLWFNALVNVTANNSADIANVNRRLGLGCWKSNRSIQYSASHKRMDTTIARRDQGLAIHMLQSKTTPATAQPAPVMERYSGLRLALNSDRTSHQRKVANKRIRPHADNHNIIHRSRVTPKGRLGNILKFQCYHASALGESVFIHLKGLRIS